MIDFPKNVKVKVNDGSDNEFTITVRPYLLNSELEVIASQVENLPSKLQRRNIAETLIMRFCTDVKDFDVDELDVNILDAYRVNGIIERVMDCLDKDSYFLISELIDIEVGNELRTIKLLVNDLLSSVGSIQDGTAQKVLEDAVKTLENAKIDQEKIIKGKFTEK